MAGAVEEALSDASTCRVDGSNLKDDGVLDSNFCDENHTPDRTHMIFSSGMQSESSGDNTIQVKEAQTPYRPEYAHTNTHIMSGDNYYSAGHGDLSMFEGKNEIYFPKWRLPSKIRRKFTAPNEDYDYSTQETSKTVDDVNDNTVGVHSPKNSLRVCVDCNTTKTPLWRGGPQGPKSLCNACGIRYRKKRRALFASLNPDSVQSIPPKKRNNSFHTVKKQNKSSKSSGVGAAGSNHLPLQVNKLLAFCHRHGLEKGTYGNRPSTMPTSTKHSAIQRRFAQEEEEAANLLMAISYGLVYA